MNRIGEIRTENLLREYVKRFEREFNQYNGDSVYTRSLDAMRIIHLGSISEEDVTKIVEPFLYQWGRIGRVLGQDRFLGWQRNLSKKIQSNRDRLQHFRTKNLADADLNELELDTTVCYKSLKEVVWQIAAAKVLHLVCPNFFPLWDNDIAEAVRVELVRRRGRWKKLPEAFSGKDYHLYMKGAQSLLNNYKDLLSDLATEYGKPELKILDEFLWWASHRPVSLFL